MWWYNVNREKYCSLLSNMNLAPNCPDCSLIVYFTKYRLQVLSVCFNMILGGIVVIQISRVTLEYFIKCDWIHKFQITLNQRVKFNKQLCSSTIKWYVRFRSQDALWCIKLVGNANSYFFHLNLYCPFYQWR